MRGLVAKRYARALLELGNEQNNYALLQKQTRELADVWQSSSDLRSIVTNPSVRIDERRKVIAGIAAKAGWHTLLKNFSLLLLDNGRFDHVVDIANELDTLVDEQAGNVRAEVTTAQQLKDSQVATIKGAIAKLTGKNVLLETRVDPEILGGVVTRVGGTLYDGSVRTQLDMIRDSILDEV